MSSEVDETVINLEYFENIQNDDEKILFDETAAKIIFKAYNSLHELKWDQNKIEELIKCNLVEILIRIYDIGCEYLKSLPKEQPPKSDIFENSEQLKFISIVISFIRNASFYSNVFNLGIQNQDGIRILLKLLSDDDLLNAYSSSNLYKSKSKNDFFRDILGRTVGTLESLAMNSTHFLDKWHESNSVQVLLNFAEKYQEISDWKLNAYITLADIVSDEEIDKLPGLHKVIQEIVYVISLGAKAIKQGLSQPIYMNNEASVRRKMIPITDSIESKQVCMITLYNGQTEWSLSELFQGLYHMAVNDSVKNDIYSKYSMCEYLRDIIYNGNPTEVAHAIKFLWQLCFDHKVLKLVNEDKKLVEFIKQLENSTDKEVFQNAKGIMFRIESCSNKNENEQKNDTGNNKPTTTKSVVNEDKKLVESIKQPENSTDNEVSEKEKENLFRIESCNNNNDEPKNDNNKPTTTKSVANDDKKLVESIKQLENSTDKEVFENSNGMMFPIESSNNNEEKNDNNNPTKVKSDENENENESESDRNQHIMISYNSESQNMCLKIKEQLEKLKFKVWIDVSGIHGSSLDSMAKAIENSFCVLICMSEKYKMSNNCRTEAEYTFQLGKPFIPIKMQKDYKPDGWLGIMIGSKFFIDFIKYSFDTSMQKLLPEIFKYYDSNNSTMIKQESLDEQLIDTINTVQSSSDNSHSSDFLNENEIGKWSEKDVKKWLNEKKINSDIVKNVFPCNGAILYQYFLMQKEAPEFFYQSLSTAENKRISLKYVAAFQVELKLLFKNI